jgi:hypothetical protein
VLVVTGWQVRRQDDNGNGYLVATYDDRVSALARLLTFEAGQAHKQLYWVDGPATPALRGSHDLCRRLVELGRSMTDAGRTLDEFLRAWWWASRPLAHRNELDPDSVAAMFAVAAQAPPPAVLPNRPYDPDPPVGYPGWEAVVLSQLADLADFRWHSLDPASYLEQAVAGMPSGDLPVLSWSDLAELAVRGQRRG